MTVSSALTLLVEGGDGIQASTSTPRQLIDSARTRHWSFADTRLGDGAAVLFLNARQRSHLAAHGAAIEGLVGSAVQMPTSVYGGRLVALIEGVPTYSDTYEDGWAVHLTDSGTPYVDTSEAKVAGDPFGTNGGIAGFPMPTDMVRLIALHAVYGNEGRVLPIDLVPEQERATKQPSRDLAAFLSGNRLVPVLPFASSNPGHRWYQTTAVQISYVGIQTIETLDDPLQLPSVLCEALIADLALYFALQSKDCSPADRTFFEREGQRAAGAVAAAGDDLLDSVQHNTIIHRGR